MNHLLFLIPADQKELVELYALSQLDPVNGGRSLRACYSPDGQWPATHYLASAIVPAAMVPAALAIPAAFPGCEVFEFDVGVDPLFVQRTLAERGLTYMLSSPPRS